MKTSRRRLLKALGLGGGTATVSQLPSAWSKPIVESVVLPAHAQTTESDDRRSSRPGGCDFCNEGNTELVLDSATSLFWAAGACFSEGTCEDGTEVEYRLLLPSGTETMDGVGSSPPVASGGRCEFDNSVNVTIPENSLSAGDTVTMETYRNGELVCIDELVVTDDG